MSLPDLLASAFMALLMCEDPKPVYFSSPWISDFRLLQNAYGEFGALFPNDSEASEIRLSQYLHELSKTRDVRVITVANDTSRTFVERLESTGGRIDVRFAQESYHEKGVLTPVFYIEGSMNLTHSGVYVRDEKVVLHVDDDVESKQVMARAYLEFDRHWGRLR